MTWLRATTNERRPGRSFLGWYRHHRPSIFLLAIGLVAAPIFLTILSPALARTPREERTVNRLTLPIPYDDAIARLDSGLLQLPAVIRDVPDPASQAALEHWDEARLFEPETVANMFWDAWSGLTYPEHDADTIEAFRNFLAFKEQDSQLGSLFYSESYDEVSKPAMSILARDPANAARLNNVAIALFMLDASNRIVGEERELRTFRGEVFSPFSDLQFAAVRLLKDIAATFGSQTPVEVPLNLALIQSSMVANGGGIEPAIETATGAVESYPENVTARVLLASIQSRQVATDAGHEEAIATLEPLLNAADTLPVGQAAIGDAYLQAALYRDLSAPFQARELARAALDAYDLALQRTEDPGVYAGRASTLAILGLHDEAIASLKQAIGINSDAPELYLSLAILQQQAGDIQGMHKSAMQGLELTSGNWNPKLSEMRVILDMVNYWGATRERQDRGYLGTSIGSDRNRLGIAWTVGGAGGYIVSADIIPKTNNDYEPWAFESARSGFLPWHLGSLAIDAAIILGEPALVQSVADLYLPSFSGDQFGTWKSKFESSVRLAAERGGIEPPVSDERWHNLPRPNYEVELLLRRSGLFAEAQEYCERYIPFARDGSLELAEDTAELTRNLEALMCAGESAYLAGEYQTAAELLAIAASVTSGRTDIFTDPEARNDPPLRAAAAAWTAGQIDNAVAMFTLVADTSTIPTIAAIADLKLGDIAADQRNIDDAISHYTASIERLVQFEYAQPSELRPSDLSLASALGLLQNAYNNRGIARLRQLQTADDVAPGCAGEQKQRCQDAADDFAKALEYDPMNPVYLLNAGWAARLLGDVEAAVGFLSQAVEIDPTMHPALNDLGVMAAQSGDLREAERAFELALAVEPDYGLAAWNLGVLKTQSGVLSIPRGQALLARAVELSPAFKTDDLQYKTDERVYRVAIGPNETVDADWAFGRSYAIVSLSLSTLTFLAIVIQTLKSQIKDEAISLAKKHARKRFDRAGEYVRRTVPRPAWVGLRGSRWIPWLATLPVLVLVTAVPALQKSTLVGSAYVALGLLATALAIGVHEVGHKICARLVNARVEPQLWGTGIALAVTLLPLRLSSGPFVGHLVTTTSAKHRWWVYMSGPIANLVLVVTAIDLYFVEPLPFLRLLAQVNLAVATFALIPLAPMDGKALKELHPRVVAGTSLAISGIASALTLGVI